MLEQNLENLTNAINALTQQLMLMNQSQGAASPAQSTKPVEAVLAEAAPSPKSSKPKAPPKEQLTHKDLQDICLEILRFDRSLKPAVVECIATFDGAEKLQDIASEDLPTLKTKLLALKDQQ